MKYYIYILHSLYKDRYYIGQTNDLEKRLERHNSGYVRSTKGYRPWTLVYFEEYDLRADAIKRERHLKSLKSKTKIKELVEGSL